jgi:hypothetical protein
MVLSSIVLIMSDNAALSAPSSNDFATLCGGTIITNGVKLSISDGVADILDISVSNPIIKFSDLALLCGDGLRSVAEAGSTNRLVATISMDDLFGQMPVLPVGHKVVALLNDDFSTLDFFKIGVVGFSL